MANSFGDQLLKAGLVNRDQLNKAKKSKYRQQKQKKKQDVDEATVAARQAAAEKADRDRELNRRHKEELERQAVQAQVRQLIESSRLSLDGGELGYHFQDGPVIKTIHVTEAVRDRLGRGQLAIARFEGGYAVIPAEVAEKIMLRDNCCIVGSTATEARPDEDDAYADYQVPDDLIW